MSFRLKTILGIALIQTVLLLLLIFTALNFVKSAQNRDIIDRAQTTINMFATTSRDAILSSDLATLNSACHEILENPAIVYVRILDSHQRVMASAGKQSILDAEFRADESLQSAEFDGIFDIASDISISNVILGTIQLGLSTENLLRDINQIQNYSLGVALIEIILMAILSFALGSWLTRQLTLLGNAADSIAAGELGYSVEATGNDEIAHTIRAFNSMSEQLRETEKHRLRTMKQLEHAEEQSRLLLTSAAEGIIEIDTDQNIIFTNPAAEKMLQSDDTGQVPQSVPDLMVSQNSPVNSIHQCLEDGHTIHVEDTWFTTTDGNQLNVEYTCAPIMKDSTISGAVIIFSNISKRKEAEEAIIRAHRAELESAQSKADFMANISHELRTPMNGVIGLLQLIDKKKLSASYAEYIQAAEDAAYHLMKLIEDILDITAINSDKLKLASIDFHMKQATEECIQMNRLKAEKKGLDLTLHYDARHDWVRGDRARLQQILNNLIDNAIKFTHKGQVEVRVESLEAGNPQVDYRFSVADTGIGIAQKYQPRLFNYFQQADTSSTREYGGAGIGLSICQSLVNKMGGRIYLNSQLNKGSTFIFELSFNASHLEEQARQYVTDKPANLPQYDGQVLLVEDNPVNQIVSSKVCNRFGLTYRIAENFSKALQETKENDFDLVFIDSQLTRQNGFEILEQIRKPNAKAPHQVIIAMTINHRDETSHTPQTTGFDDFINKPLDQEGMERILERWLSAKRRDNLS